jgi:hypothetical protein
MSYTRRGLRLRTRHTAAIAWFQKPRGRGVRIPAIVISRSRRW